MTSDHHSDIALRRALFALRLSVFLVMLMWTIDKFVRPDHAAGVFAGFYYLKDLGSGLMTAFGIVELLIIFGFGLGWKKHFTYGFVLAVHSISTVSSFKQYFAPFSGLNLLFFAAWPMLAACYALFVLRERDVLFSLSSD